MGIDDASVDVETLIKRHLAGGPFSVVSLDLSETSALSWVRFRVDPKRFVPGIFEGDWAVASDHPQPGSIRVVRVLTGLDDVTRAIGRQGQGIFATPWM